MATNVATLTARLVADTSQFRQGMAQADASINKTKGSMLGAFGKGAAITAGLAGAAVAFRAVSDEMMAMEKNAAQTNAVLKSTNGVANVTADGVKNLAKAISDKSGLDDQAIQSASNLLLTFKNVRNEVGKGADIFNRATKAAVDLSVAGFGDMASTAKMLGKALNDPIKGIQAMSRAGVTFTEKQKELIKSLVESGNLLQAQKVILKEVESQVGGSAEAYGKTLPGQIGKLKEALTDIGVQVGTMVTPALRSAATAAAAFARALEPINRFAFDSNAGMGALVFNLGKAAGLFSDNAHDISPAAQKWAKAHMDVSAAADRHTGSLKALRNESRALINDQLGLNGALLNAQSSAQAYAEAVKAGGAESLDARIAAQNLAQDILAAGQAAREHGGGVQAEIATLNLLKGTLEGPLRAAIDAHIAKLMGIPPFVDTKIRLISDEAQWALDQWLAGNRSHEITVKVGAQFVGDIAGGIYTQTSRTGGQGTG